MPTTRALFRGMLCLAFTMAMAPPSLGQSTPSAVPTEAADRDSSEPDTSYRNVPDATIAGRVLPDQWFDCLRTVEATPTQREEITPLVREYLKQRRAWKTIGLPQLKRLMERRRELQAAGADLTEVTKEIGTLRTKNPSLTKLRREVWNRLDKPQRFQLINALKITRESTAAVRPVGETAKTGKGRPEASAPGSSEGIGAPDSPTLPVESATARPSVSPKTQPKTPTTTQPKAPASSDGDKATSDAGKTAVTGEGSAQTTPSKTTPSKTASSKTASGKTAPDEPAPWSFDD